MLSRSFAGKSDPKSKNQQRIIALALQTDR